MTIEVDKNIKTGFYEGTENGILFQLTFEQLQDLKKFFTGSQGFEPRIITWYNSLNRFDKKKVRHRGAPELPDDFFPDPEAPE